jgi:hypothetical protein
MTTTKITPEMLDELEEYLSLRTKHGQNNLDIVWREPTDIVPATDVVLRASTLRALIEQAKLLQELRDAYAPLNSGEYLSMTEHHELSRRFDEVLEKVLGS